MKMTSLDDICEEPFFQKISGFVPMGSAELCEILAPLIEKHLTETNGDRISTLAEYLSHHEASLLQDKTLDSLQTLATYSSDLSLSELKGSYCYGMNQDLISRLPSHIKAYFVPATLFPSTLQPYWPVMCHEALVIPFCNPKDKEDSGYILLDPHIKMDTPLVTLFSGKRERKNLKEKGFCTFFYEDGKIVSKSSLSTEKTDFSMTYYIKEVTNSAKYGLRIGLATDRNSLLFSRKPDGSIKAYLSLLFDENIIRYHIGGKPKKEIPFKEFLSRKLSLESDLIEALAVDESTLLANIEKILLQKDFIDDLYQKCRYLIKSDERASEFYLPSDLT